MNVEIRPLTSVLYPGRGEATETSMPGGSSRLSLRKGEGRGEGFDAMNVSLCVYCSQVL